MTFQSPEFDGLTPWPEAEVQRYTDAGVWGDFNLARWLNASLESRRDEIVLSGPGFPSRQWQDLSGGELQNLVRNLTRGLRRLGLNRGDRVVMQMGNSNAFVVTLFALIEIGVIPVMALPGHRRREIEHFICLTNAKAWIASDAEPGMDFAALGSQLLAAVPGLERVILNQTPGKTHLALTSLLSDENTPFPDLMGSADPAGIALLLCSGGTTGLPKLIPRTHRDYIFNASASAQVCGLTADDVYLVALPAAHNFPLACPGIFGAISTGAKIVMCPSPSPETAFECIGRTGATVTALVPPLVRVWLEQAARVAPPPESLRLLQAGGARLDAGLARRVRAELGCALQHVFGMAEGLLNFTRPGDPDITVFNTQGRPLSDFDEIRIVDADGVVVPPGKRGELWTRGPYTLRGYYKDPEANRLAFTDEGFYRSGDLVRQLSSGHLIVEGRIREVIRRGAETVSVEALETLLAGHEAVQDVAVIGVPCERLGEQVCAVLVIKSAAAPPDLRELRHFLSEKGVARFMLPDAVECIDRLPLTAVGKIARRQLAAQIQQSRLKPETQGIAIL